MKRVFIFNTNHKILKYSSEPLRQNTKFSFVYFVHSSNYKLTPLTFSDPPHNSKFSDPPPPTHSYSTLSKEMKTPTP